MESIENKQLLFAETEIRYSGQPINVPKHIYGIEESFSLIKSAIGDKCVEHLLALYMDSGYETVAISQIGKGSSDTIEVSVSEIMRIAILTNSKFILLAHNHPSGVMKPSDKDIVLTKNIAKACALFNIRLIDSVIVSRHNDYFSIRTEIAKHGEVHNDNKG